LLMEEVRVFFEVVVQGFVLSLFCLDTKK